MSEICKQCGNPTDAHAYECIGEAAWRDRERYDAMTEDKAKQMVSNAYAWVSNAMHTTPMDSNGRYMNSGASTILAKAEQCIGTHRTVVVINNVIQYGREL